MNNVQMTRHRTQPHHAHGVGSYGIAFSGA
jgi:hypothetical protein